MKKYLISIESIDGFRLKNFFKQKIFSHFESEFKKIGVVGKNLSIDQYFSLAVVGQQKPLSPGELGCTLSHVKALNDFVESNSDYALVIEDDAIEVNYFDLNQLDKEINNLNLKKCFFLSLGGVQLNINNKLRGRIEKNKIFEQKILKLHSFSIQSLCYTYAYVVDKAMAQVLIDYHKKPHVCDHWDEIYQFNKNVNFYVTFLFDHPEIIHNEKIESDIEDERKQMINTIDRRKPILQKFRNSLMKKWLNIFYEKYPK